MRSVDVNGTTIAYREAGEGPVALLVHGFPLDNRLWLDQLRRLAASRRVVAPDLRGFGASAPLGSVPLSMELLADDLAALLGELGVTEADVVGLSMGGYAALALWERHREAVRSICLMDTRASADDEDGRAARERLAELTVDQGTGRLADEMMGRLLSPGASLQARARTRSMVESTPYETVVAALLAMRDRPDREHLLEEITVPALVVVGEEDAVTPPATARRMAERIPGALLAVVAGAGHLPPVERPSEVDRVLEDFLAELGQ